MLTIIFSNVTYNLQSTINIHNSMQVLDILQYFELRKVKLDSK